MSIEQYIPPTTDIPTAIAAIFLENARSTKVAIHLSRVGIAPDMQKITKVPDLLYIPFDDAIQTIIATQRVDTNIDFRTADAYFRDDDSYTTQSDFPNTLISSREMRILYATMIAHMHTLQLLASSSDRRTSYTRLVDPTALPYLEFDLEDAEVSWLHDPRDSAESTQMLDRLRKTAQGLVEQEKQDISELLRLGHFFAISVDNHQHPTA